MEMFDVSASVDIAQFKSSDLDESKFEDIIELLKIVFEKIGVNAENKVVYYQRFCDGKSVLAIKVLDGVDEDKNNYMFVGCNTKYYGNDKSCDVYMHAEAKAGQISIKISNLIASKIVGFFETIEQDLLDKNATKLEAFLRFTLVKEKEQELLINNKVKTIGPLRKIIGNIFGVKNEN